MKTAESYGVDQIEMGFSIVSEKLKPFSNLHSHNEIEIGIAVKGGQLAVIGRHRFRVVPDRLIVFWANKPHGPVQVDPGHAVISMFIPLAWFLNWHLPPQFVEAILHGEVIVDSPQKSPCSDIQLMQHWVKLMDGGEEARRILLLEVEARLRRMATEHADKLGLGNDNDASDPADKWSKYEQMVTLLAERYREPLTVDDVAEAVGLHPVYAMRLFKKMSGTTIQQCIIRHRISHAQRLLATTKSKILTIAMDSGFNSITQFYTSFRHVVGRTPRKYRQSLRGG